MKKLLTILLLLPLYAVPQVILDASQSVGANKYEWTQISGYPIYLESPDSVYCPVNDLREGNYSFRLTVSNDCCTDVDVVKFHWPLLEVKVIGTKIKIVSTKAQPLRITLVNTVGQVLDKREIFLLRGENDFELNKPAQGLYFLNFSNNEFNQTEKIIVR